MPNWCKNNLRIHGNGEKVLEVLEMLKDEKGNMTFSKIVPMPDEINNTQSPVSDTIPQEKRKELIEKYGSDNWYDWSIKNWGCKWDAHDSDFYEYDGDWIATFQTPWTPPMEFVTSLSKQFDKMTFELQFADESESQYPLGHAEFENGAYTLDGPIAGTNEAQSFAEQVWNENWVDDWTEIGE